MTGVLTCALPIYNAFANMLDSLMNNPVKREKMSMKAVESIKRFSLDVVYAQWLKELKND